MEILGMIASAAFIITFGAIGVVYYGAMAVSALKGMHTK